MSTYVYGSLMSPEVLQVLINRMPQSQPARLRGYRRYGLRGYSFPAIAAATQQDEVQGLVLSGLSPEELYVFDEFEDEGYVKTGVRALLADGTAVDTQAYVWSDSQRHLLQGEWDYGAWRTRYLAGYLDMCARWRAQLPPYTQAHM